jgi:hypothetical protein
MTELQKISLILGPVLVKLNSKHGRLELTPISVSASTPLREHTWLKRLLHAVLPPMHRPSTRTIMVWVAGTVTVEGSDSTLYIDLESGEAYISRCSAQRHPVLLEHAEPEDHTDEELRDLLDAVRLGSKPWLTIHDKFHAAGAFPSS